MKGTLWQVIVNYRKVECCKFGEVSMSQIMDDLVVTIRSLGFVSRRMVSH